VFNTLKLDEVRYFRFLEFLSVAQCKIKLVSTSVFIQCFEQMYSTNANFKWHFILNSNFGHEICKDRYDIRLTIGVLDGHSTRNENV